MGAIDFELASSFLNNRRQDIQNKDKMTNLFMGTPKTLFDLGGDIQMHGGDYKLGQIYEVTEEEANRLKAMGYGFTIVG